MFQALKFYSKRVLPLLILSFAHAESFSERFASLNLTPEQIFYVPQEKDPHYFYYQAGQVDSWKRYSKEKSPLGAAFNGYILFSDPYHLGHKKVSFHLGADCSNFIHRLFQVLGADYPFAKTRYFLAMGNNALRPEGLNECMWENLKKSFDKINIGSQQVGDVMVYATTSDDLGERGHMGIVSSLNPFAVLQAKYKKGFINEETNLEELLRDKKVFFFRYKKELVEIPSRKLSDLLQQSYPANNSGCTW